MNVLLTCAGRRNYMVQFFQEALGKKGLVFACDASQEASALQDADESFLVPSVSDDNYFDSLIEICKQKKVRLLIPLNDLELPYLSRQRDRFLSIGTIPVVSDPEVIDTCFDKFATFEFLQKIGVSVPKTYVSLSDAKDALKSGEISFPLVVKPRWGSGSIGIEYPEDEEELDLAYRFVKKTVGRSILAKVSSTDFERCILIQEKLIGPEYGVGIVNDLDTNHMTTFIKRKLAMRAGETDKAYTVHNDEIKQIAKTISKSLCHRGNLDCDVIIGENGAKVIELNPRFGGGYPFSHVAGANIPAALIAWANNDPINPDWLTVQENITSTKCDRIVIIRKQKLEFKS